MLSQVVVWEAGLAWRTWNPGGSSWRTWDPGIIISSPIAMEKHITSVPLYCCTAIANNNTIAADADTTITVGAVVDSTNAAELMSSNNKEDLQTLEPIAIAADASILDSAESESDAFMSVSSAESVANNVATKSTYVLEPIRIGDTAEMHLQSCLQVSTAGDESGTDAQGDTLIQPSIIDAGTTTNTCVNTGSFIKPALAHSSAGNDEIVIQCMLSPSSTLTNALHDSTSYEAKLDTDEDSMSAAKTIAAAAAISIDAITADIVAAITNDDVGADSVNTIAINTVVIDTTTIITVDTTAVDVITAVVVNAVTTSTVAADVVAAITVDADTIDGVTANTVATNIVTAITVDATSTDAVAADDIAAITVEAVAVDVAAVNTAINTIAADAIDAAAAITIDINVVDTFAAVVVDVVTTVTINMSVAVDKSILSAGISANAALSTPVWGHVTSVLLYCCTATATQQSIATYLQSVVHLLFRCPPASKVHLHTYNQLITPSSGVRQLRWCTYTPTISCSPPLEVSAIESALSAQLQSNVEQRASIINAGETPIWRHATFIPLHCYAATTAYSTTQSPSSKIVLLSVALPSVTKGAAITNAELCHNNENALLSTASEKCICVHSTSSEGGTCRLLDFRYAAAEASIAINEQGVALAQPVVNAIGALSSSKYCSSNMGAHTGVQVDTSDAGMEPLWCVQIMCANEAACPHQPSLLQMVPTIHAYDKKQPSVQTLISTPDEGGALIQPLFTVAGIAADAHQGGALIQPSVNDVGTSVMVYEPYASSMRHEASVAYMMALAKSLHLPSSLWYFWSSIQNVCTVMNCSHAVMDRSCQDTQDVHGLLCKAEESTMTMRIYWDMVDPAKGSHARWGVMSSEDSKEIAAPDFHLHVIISSSSGVSWIIYHAEMCIHPVEAWWAGVSDASLPTKLDCATDGVTKRNKVMPTPDLTPSAYSEDAQMLSPLLVNNGFPICWHLPYLLYMSG